MDSCRGYVELVAVCGDYLNEPPLISKLFSPGVSLSLSPSLLLGVSLLPAAETSTRCLLSAPSLAVILLPRVSGSTFVGRARARMLDPIEFEFRGPVNVAYLYN